MQPKRSKYDTNPLDENVAERADESFKRDTGSQGDPRTQDMAGAATQEIGRTSNEAARNDPEAEAATRRIDDSYPSVFVSKNPRQQTYEPPRPPPQNIYQPPPVPLPNVYQPPPVPVNFAPGSRKVSGLGIAEKWAVVLPYLPIGFVIAIIAGVVELLLVPKNETRVRYHAAQGLILQVGIAAISAFLGGLDLVLSGRFTGGWLFRFASFIFLIVAMVRVWKGKPMEISVLDEPRKWVEDKIKPRN
jgi:uncharacterized membrane protein